MILTPIGCTTIAFGIRGPFIALRSMEVALWRSEQVESAPARSIIAACIGYVYGAGAFVFLASLLTLINCYYQSGTFGVTGNIGQTLSATIASLIYTVVFAELVLRPLKYRLGVTRLKKGPNRVSLKPRFTELSACVLVRLH